MLETCSVKANDNGELYIFKDCGTHTCPFYPAFSFLGNVANVYVSYFASSKFSKNPWASLGMNRRALLVPIALHWYTVKTPLGTHRELSIFYLL